MNNLQNFTQYKSEQELLEAFAGIAFQKQHNLAEIIGNNDWNADLTSGIVTFGDFEAPIQILGTYSYESETWLWAWANTQSELSAEITQQANALKIFGEKQNIDFLSVSPSASDVIVRSRLTLHYLELPLEIRWRNATPESHKFWRIHTGFKVSYLVGGTFSYESKTIGDDRFKANEIANKLQYGAYVAFGFNTWNPYIYYGFNPIFDKNKTTKKRTEP